MTILYTSIIDTTSISDSTRQSQVESILIQIEQTAEGQVLFNNILQGTGSINVTNNESVDTSYTVSTSTVNLNWGELTTTQASFAGGVYDVSSLNRTLVHELVHAAEAHLNPQYTTTVEKQRDRIEIETTTFTNKYMEKYYQEPHRNSEDILKNQIFNPYDLKRNQPPKPLQAYNELNEDPNYEPPWDMNDMLDLLYDPNQPSWWESIQETYGDIKEFFGDLLDPDPSPNSSVPVELGDLPLENIPGADVTFEAWKSGSPLVFDLDGDGAIELVSVDNSTAFFDFWSDGFAKKIGWVSADDGLLVHDIDQDGVIEGVSELFGSPYLLGNLLETDFVGFQTTNNGFGALQLHDSNGDGVIDANDTVWTELQIWQDANQDGVSQASELVTLDTLGIASIDVSNFVLDMNAQTGNFNRIIEGNVISHSGFYTLNDGTTHEVVDAWLSLDVQNTSYVPDYNLDLRALFLPTARGYGTLPDLHIAMSIDNGVDGLLEKISNFATARTLGETFSDFDAVRAEVQDILFSWAGIDVNASAIYKDHGVFGDLPEFAFLRKLTGSDSEFLGTWFDQSGLLPLISDGMESIFQSWEQVLDIYTARLVFQSVGEGVFETGASYNPFTDQFEGTIALSQTGIAILEAEATLHADKEGFWHSFATYVDRVMDVTQLTATETTWLTDAVSNSSGGALSWGGILGTLTAQVVDVSLHVARTDVNFTEHLFLDSANDNNFKDERKRA